MQKAKVEKEGGSFGSRTGGAAVERLQPKQNDNLDLQPWIRKIQKSRWGKNKTKARETNEELWGRLGKKNRKQRGRAKKRVDKLIHEKGDSKEPHRKVLGIRAQKSKTDYIDL